MEEELVSIIMPVYNCEEYLEKSIKSIENQTYKNWELIIVNDNSSDKSKKIIEENSNPDVSTIIYPNTVTKIESKTSIRKKRYILTNNNNYEKMTKKKYRRKIK